MKTTKYGIFGTGEVTIDDSGFIDMPVIVQESGLFGGRSPDELRIVQIGMHDEPEFNRQYVAKLNRHTDLPFYLATAKVKIVSTLEKVTDEDNDKLGISRLED